MTCFLARTRACIDGAVLRRVGTAVHDRFVFAGAVCGGLYVYFAWGPPDLIFIFAFLLCWCCASSNLMSKFEFGGCVSNSHVVYG